MSETALVWLVLYCSAAIGTFINPVFGLLGYMLEYYLRPELRWWGDELPNLRWNLIISVAFGLSFLLRRSSLRQMASVRNPVLRWLFSLNGLMLAITATIAVNPHVSWAWTVQWMKMAIIIPLLMIGVIRSRGAFNAFAAAHMMGGFWWGWESWNNPHRKQGRLENVGSGDTQNDNAASIHLLTILPFVLTYLLTEKDKRLRLVALISAPFVVNTLILCNSRGAMVGLAAGMLAALFLAPHGYRARLSGIALITGIAFIFLADPQFVRRQQTTADPQDRSANERILSWKGGLALVRDHPFGAGGRGFHLLSPKYIPDIVQAHGDDPRAPHNTYVMTMSEWGIPGLFCYLGIIGSTLLMLRKVQRQANGTDFFFWRAFAIQVAIISAAVASTFTDRLYGEAMYWMCGVAYALCRLQATEQAEALATAALAPVEQPRPLRVLAYPTDPAPAR